jgi:hypothetical protein
MDSTPVFQIFDVEGYRLRYDQRMVYRQSNDSLWSFFDQGDKLGSTSYYHFNNDSAFTSDSVYIAYWFPWSYADQVDYIGDIAGSSPHLRNPRVAGLSQQGRNIYAYEITDTNWTDCNKKDIVWTGRQHSTEFIQSFVTKGLTDYLLYSNDPLADSVRKYFRFHFYPMMNPDGVYNGGGTANGSDPNRNWNPGGQPGVCTETNVVMTDLLTHLGGPVAISFDIHSNPGHRGEWYWWGQVSGPNPTHTGFSAMVVDAIAAQDSADHGGSGIFEDHICCNSFGGIALTAGNWFYNEFGANSFTLEPSSVPGESIARLESAGASIARGLAAIITGPAPIRIYPVLNGPSCNGDSSGSIALNLSGGASPLIYQWSSGATSSLASGLLAGSYTVTVTDDSACTLVRSFSLSEPSALAISSTVIPNLCAGDSSGSIDLSVSGGTPPYAYAWSNGAQTEDLSGLPAGTHALALTDSNGCFHRDTFYLNDPPALLGAISSSGNVAWINAAGGTPPYFYLWSDSNATNSDTLVANASGTFLVTVTDSVGCQYSDSIPIIFVGRSNPAEEYSRVYPSVGDGNLTIRGLEGAEIHVWDSWGKQVLAPCLVPDSGLIRLRLQQSGIYLVRIQNESWQKNVLVLVR